MSFSSAFMEANAFLSSLPWGEYLIIKSLAPNLAKTLWAEILGRWFIGLNSSKAASYSKTVLHPEFWAVFEVVMLSQAEKPNLEPPTKETKFFTFLSRKLPASLIDKTLRILKMLTLQSRFSTEPIIRQEVGGIAIEF